MVIQLHGQIPKNERLILHIKNETKILDNKSHMVTLTFDEKKIYELEITSEYLKRNQKVVAVFLYLMKAVIVGAYHLLSLNINSNWYEGIRAYRIKASVWIDLQKDTDIQLTFVNARFIEQSQVWMQPVFTVSPGFITKIHYIPNGIDFYNQYFNYVKRVVSIFVVLLALFATLMSIAISNVIITAMIIILVLSLWMISIVIILLLSQYRKLHYLYHLLLE